MPFVSPIKSGKRLLQHGGKQLRGITLEGMSPPPRDGVRQKTGYTGIKLPDNSLAAQTPFKEVFTYSKSKALRNVIDAGRNPKEFERDLAMGLVPHKREGMQYVFEDAVVQNWITTHSAATPAPETPAEEDADE